MKADEMDKLKKLFSIGQKRTVVDKLISTPIRDTELNTPTTDVFEKNETHQIDLLSMPEDDGFGFCLVVVDLYSRMLGAMAIKYKDSETVAKALLNVYKNNKYLSVPKTLEMDPGSEFKGEFKKMFEKKGVILKYKRTGRHRSQAMVETYNGIIAKYLLKRQLSTEISMKGEELDGDWVEDLPKLITLLNEIRIIKNKNPTTTKREERRSEASHKGQTPIGEGSALNLLDLGQMVRIQLDEPRDIQGTKQHGKFRKADIRWSTTPYKIIQYSFRPNQPPMYLLEGVKNAAYTKNQLQVISDNDKPPAPETIKKYIIEKIVSKRKYKNKLQYEVKWKGYGSKDNTFEYASEIPKSFIEAFNKAYKG